MFWGLETRLFAGPVRFRAFGLRIGGSRCTGTLQIFVTAALFESQYVVSGLPVPSSRTEYSRLKGVVLYHWFYGYCIGIDKKRNYDLSCNLTILMLIQYDNISQTRQNIIA